MPRAGSRDVPPDRPTPLEPMSIGEAADPPFAVLPDPSSVFGRRASRFAALAGIAEDLGPYLGFLARVCAAQHAALTSLPPALLPDDEALARAAAHGMPPLARGEIRDDAGARAALAAVLDNLAEAQTPPATAEAIRALRALSDEDIETLLSDALGEPAEDADMAAFALAGAALQVHFTRMAAGLDAGTLTPIAHGVCPACGAPPVASAVVGWKGAANSRFCTCAVCATQWHVPRVTCLSCGEQTQITFYGVEGGAEALKAETCGACNHYVKILYQTKAPALDPIADDVASLPLDLMLGEEGYARFARNPFLAGY